LARPGATHLQIAAAGVLFESLSLKRIFRRIGLGQGRLGIESGKRSILQKNLYLHFMMMRFRHPFSALTPENTQLLRENQYNYMRFGSLSLPFHCPLRARFQPVGLPAGGEARIHYSIVPAFQSHDLEALDRLGGTSVLCYFAIFL